MKTLKQNQSQHEILLVHCKKCSNKTKHLVLQSADQNASQLVDIYDESLGYIEWLDQYQLIQCKACDNISFRHLEWFSEAQDEFDSGSREHLYPKRENNPLTAKRFRYLPPSIQRIYQETITAYNYEAYTLCAGGLRALVEGICADQIEVKRKASLPQKIAGLSEKGVLTNQSAQILHEHRFLGNEALHELQQPSINELSLAIEIIEHTLQELYEIKGKANDLRRARNERQKPS